MYINNFIKVAYKSLFDNVIPFFIDLKTPL